MKRVFVRGFSQGFHQGTPSMYHDHSIYRVMFACSCKFEIAKFWHSKFHSNVWDGKHASLSSPNFDTQNSTKICGVYLASMQVG